MNISRGKDEDDTRGAFCRALCVGQIPREYDRNWMNVCYHAFSSLLREHLPDIPLDRELARHADADIGLTPQSRDTILRDHCGKRMTGRCLCITSGNLIGMGSGLMASGDIIVVPLGCYTPVVLRSWGHGRWTFVGDVYVDAYMFGRAVEEWNSGTRKLSTYEIC